MTGQQLKNSILQMAVQGKLVPQDPNDEPASVLLERIRKEKEQLIKEGKIKKEKNPSYIFRGADNLPYENDYPFEIPNNWLWLKHNDLFEISGGSQPPKSKFINEPKAGYIRLFQIRDYGDKPVPVYIPESTATKTTKKGDILLARYGASLGKVFWAENGAYNVAMAKVIPLYGFLSEYIFNKYLFYYYHTDLYRSVIMGNSRSAQAGFNKDDLENMWFPVPPIAEQNRIVICIEQILPLVDLYGVHEQKLIKLNNQFSDLLKKSILQEAVQGKLVPQDPADEPASVLLDRIRAEKEQLIKAGKIKRDKHESVIFRRDNSHYEKRGSEEVCIDDEIPFEIPESWCWSRLSTLCKSISDGDHQPPPQVPSGIPFAVISNVSSGRIDLSNTRFVPQDYYKNLHESRIPHRDDILFTVTGSYGIVIPVDIDDAFCFQRHIALLKPLQIATEFLSTWLDTPVVYEQCKHCATGTAQKTVGLNSLKNILVPIPPANEQVRILEQLKKVLPSITL